MYVSHKYKLIFLRTPKTASSSLSEFFIKNIPDKNAVYTGVEDSRPQIEHTLHPSIIAEHRFNFKYYHFTLQDLVDNNIITPKQAKEYKSIAVIRNTVDRQKSFYYFYKKWKVPGTEPSLQQYNAWTTNGYFKGEPNSAILQSDMLRLYGNIAGEYWLYENINNEINALMYDLNLPIIEPLVNHKSEFRKDRRNEIVFDKKATTNMLNYFRNDIDLYNELKEETYV